MGAAHARAYARIPEFEIAGLVNRGESKREALAGELGNVPHFADLDDALIATRPDAVCICTFTESHAPLAVRCLEAGLHVFIEKPLAATTADAETVIAAARKAGRALVVGYILRHHPTWERFVELARTLGSPLVMRMNMNQQSDGATWETHKGILNSTSPLVDVGVHYVDVMCQMTRSRPVSVHAIGARLTDEISPESMNYGQLQVRFEDGSVGWFESGFGPMLSQTAFFVKDVFGPKGSVSLLGTKSDAAEPGASGDRESHTGSKGIRVHSAELDAEGRFARPDDWYPSDGEPALLDLCEREQRYFLKAALAGLDLSDHWQDAVESLRVTLAAEESARTGSAVAL